MRHRKLCLCQICAEILEKIAGYFEKIPVQRWREQDFFEEFDCFYSQSLLIFIGAHELKGWHKLHQILLNIQLNEVKL